MLSHLNMKSSLHCWMWNQNDSQDGQLLASSNKCASHSQNKHLPRFFKKRQLWMLRHSRLTDETFHISDGYFCISSKEVHKILQFCYFYDMGKSMIKQIVVELRAFKKKHKALGSCSFSDVVGRLLATPVVTRTTSTNSPTWWWWGLKDGCRSINTERGEMRVSFKCLESLH